jgi:hypothetical protein
VSFNEGGFSDSSISDHNQFEFSNRGHRFDLLDVGFHYINNQIYGPCCWIQIGYGRRWRSRKNHLR